MDRKPVFVVLGAVIILLCFVVWAIYSSPGSRDVSTTPKVASEVEKQPIVYVTDDQIYREFEICMNRAKAQIGDNKLEARRQATSCMMQLSKYGHDRAKKAFNIYWDLD